MSNSTPDFVADLDSWDFIEPEDLTDLTTKRPLLTHIEQVIHFRSVKDEPNDIYVRSHRTGIDIASFGEVCWDGTTTLNSIVIPIEHGKITGLLTRQSKFDPSVCIECSPEWVPVGARSVDDFDDWAAAHCPTCGGRWYDAHNHTWQWHNKPVTTLKTMLNYT